MSKEIVICTLLKYAPTILYPMSFYPELIDRYKPYVVSMLRYCLYRKVFKVITSPRIAKTLAKTAVLAKDEGLNEIAELLLFGAGYSDGVGERVFAEDWSVYNSPSAMIKKAPTLYRILSVYSGNYVSANFVRRLLLGEFPDAIAEIVERYNLSIRCGT